MGTNSPASCTRMAYSSRPVTHGRVTTEQYSRRSTGLTGPRSPSSNRPAAWLAVGANSIVEPVAFTSMDVKDWVPREAGGLKVVVCGGGQFVALGYAGTVLTSADGVNWVQHPTGIESTLNHVKRVLSSPRQSCRRRARELRGSSGLLGLEGP